MTPGERRRLAGEIASSMGFALGQEYVTIDGWWWLRSSERAIRPLSAEEIDWHIARNHAPFVPGGVAKGDPRWWDDPSP